MGNLDATDGEYFPDHVHTFKPRASPNRRLALKLNQRNLVGHQNLQRNYIKTTSGREDVCRQHQ